MGKPLKRNVWCKNYTNCLDQAINARRSFTCNGCRFEANRGDRDELQDFFNPGLCGKTVKKPLVFHSNI